MVNPERLGPAVEHRSDPLVTPRSAKALLIGALVWICGLAAIALGHLDSRRMDLVEIIGVVASIAMLVAMGMLIAALLDPPSEP